MSTQKWSNLQQAAYKPISTLRWYMDHLMLIKKGHSKLSPFSASRIWNRVWGVRILIHVFYLQQQVGALIFYIAECSMWELRCIFQHFNIYSYSAHKTDLFFVYDSYASFDVGKSLSSGYDCLSFVLFHQFTMCFTFQCEWSRIHEPPYKTAKYQKQWEIDCWAFMALNNWNSFWWWWCSTNPGSPPIVMSRVMVFAYIWMKITRIVLWFYDLFILHLIKLNKFNLKPAKNSLRS